MRNRQDKHGSARLSQFFPRVCSRIYQHSWHLLSPYGQSSNEWYHHWSQHNIQDTVSTRLPDLHESYTPLSLTLTTRGLARYMLTDVDPHLLTRDIHTTGNSYTHTSLCHETEPHLASHYEYIPSCAGRRNTHQDWLGSELIGSPNKHVYRWFFRPDTHQWTTPEKCKC